MGKINTTRDEAMGWLGGHTEAWRWKGLGQGADLKKSQDAHSSTAGTKYPEESCVDRQASNRPEPRQDSHGRGGGKEWMPCELFIHHGPTMNHGSNIKPK